MESCSLGGELMEWLRLSVRLQFSGWGRGRGVKCEDGLRGGGMQLSPALKVLCRSQWHGFLLTGRWSPSVGSGFPNLEG